MILGNLHNSLHKNYQKKSRYAHFQSNQTIKYIKYPQISVFLKYGRHASGPPDGEW